MSIYTVYTLKFDCSIMLSEAYRHNELSKGKSAYHYPPNTAYIICAPEVITPNDIQLVLRLFIKRFIIQMVRLYYKYTIFKIHLTGRLLRPRDRKHTL